MQLINDLPKFTVLIPFRNESSVLPILIEGIQSQELNSNGFEVIFIDDHSTDQSFSLIKDFKSSYSIKLLKNNGSGKKAALLTGIQASQNSIIMTLDADVELSPNSFQASISEFVTKDLIMLCGLITLKTNHSIFQDIQKAESAAIVAISSVMLNHHLPSTCNGAHLVFDKQVFLEIGGYKHLQLASGDDDLLMHQFAKYDIKKVQYSSNFSNILASRNTENWMEFFNQRSRWVSKAKHYLFPYNSWIHFLVILNLIGFFIAITVLIFNWQLWAYFLLLIRLIIDAVLVFKLRKAFQIPVNMIVMMPFYLLYIIPLIIYSLYNKTKWKGRGI
ncbi:MAG: glycosyltransferase [Bacteroidota bacterium]|nr:glycosyltransferase [Bacteroidota bacterium]